MCNVLVCIVSRDIVAVERSRVSRCRVPLNAGSGISKVDAATRSI